jgi:hypothetical protein
MKCTDLMTVVTTCSQIKEFVKANLGQRAAKEENLTTAEANCFFT